MSIEAVEKQVVISFVAKNLVKETTDQIEINLRGVAFQFQAAAYSLGELNKMMFGGSKIGETFASVLHGVGVALRLTTVAQQLATVATAVLGTNVATLAKEYIILMGVEAAHIAKVIALTIAEWAHVIALKAKAIAEAVWQAIASGGFALPLIAAVTAAAVGIVASAIPSRHFGGRIEQAGLYYLSSGEVYTQGQQRGMVNNFYIYGGDGHKTADAVISKLRAAGAI